MSLSSLLSSASQFLGVRPLAARLLVYVLLFSLCLSLIATGLQLIGESDRRLSDLRNIQEKTGDIIAGNLSQQLWLMDDKGVADTLADLLAFEVVQHARITTPDGREFSVGEYPDGDVLSHERRLVADTAGITGSPVVGQLMLNSSEDMIRDELLERAMVLLLFQSLVVMLGTLGLLLIVRLTLSRHLETMADYATRLNLDALIEPLALKRRTPRKADELSEMEQALNQMRQRLLEETRDLRQNTLRSRDERDEAIRANHAKNLFLANVSHELRIPLQSVLGYASLLQDTTLDQEQSDYINTLLNAAEGLSSIIDDLLDISIMEAGRLELDAISFDLRDTLNDMIHMLGPRAREKNLALELRVDDKLPAELIGDPVRLRQILLNLTSNAIRFTDSGHVLVSVEMMGREAGLSRLRLSVEDTGVGISARDLPLIFEPYVQLGPKSRRQLPGTGLGLTICRQLVSLMNGTLDVDSAPGKGSTFWVELTLPEPTSRSARSQPPMHPIRGRRILVVDSYALSRKITLEMLARSDVAIEAVRSAAEALTALQQAQENNAPFDAVVLDGFIPDMDSDLLCRQIRDTPGWQNVRLLVLSANPQRGDGEHFRNAGADAFLSKSLRESRLTPLLSQLFADADAGERHFLTRFSLQENTETTEPRSLPCGPMDVLLVEDNPVNRALTKRLLEKLGCQVATANDGRSAADIWKSRDFDLIFMDCMMPEVDGFEATRQLRVWEARSGSSKHTPVVALTASAMEQDEERSLQAGMDAFVAKPVNLDMLRAVLEQYCDADNLEPQS
ncbi:response regulator [uncultured Marinobacter sp.]|uniref:response regulator n=1 Tax=uncultured Marinobacter sp. TaxID=187379 RepID=UPI0030DC221E